MRRPVVPIGLPVLVPGAVIALCAVVSLGALGAGTTAVHAAQNNPTIALQFTPTSAGARSRPSIDAAMLDIAAALEVEDARQTPDPRAIGKRTNADGQPFDMMVEGELVDYVWAVSERLFRQTGLKRDDRAPLVLRIILTGFEVDERSQAAGANYKASVSLSGTLERDGALVWEGRAVGDAMRYGRRSNDGNVNEAQSDALAEAITSLLNDADLHAAWSSEPQPEAVAAVPATAPEPPPAGEPAAGAAAAAGERAAAQSPPSDVPPEGAGESAALQSEAGGATPEEGAGESAALQSEAGGATPEEGAGESAALQSEAGGATPEGAGESAAVETESGSATPDSETEPEALGVAALGVTAAGAAAAGETSTATPPAETGASPNAAQASGATSSAAATPSAAGATAAGTTAPAAPVQGTASTAAPAAAGTAAAAAPAGTQTSARRALTPPQMLEELKPMMKAGAGKGILLNYVNSRGLAAPMTGADVAAWKSAGVPEDVIVAALAFVE